MSDDPGKLRGSRLAALRERGGYFDLPERTRLIFSGTDRVRYLNGQVTNDVRKLQSGVAQQACVVSAKGKLDGVVWIWSAGDQLIVEVGAELAESLAARLERYIVADDVEMSVEGAPAEGHAFGEVAERLAAADPNLRRVARLGVDGVDILQGSREFDAAERLTPEDLAVLRIERKLPTWGRELGPDTLPAEAGLERTAVDFHKGCYIGQEVISRIQSVGRTNRMLESFVLLAGPLPTGGEEIFSPAGGEKPVGAITSVAAHFELALPVGLCYIKRGLGEASGELTTAAGSRLKLCELPCE